MSFQSRKPLPAPAELFATPTFTPSFTCRLAITFAIWRERVRARRFLATMDARSLIDAGISPAAAAYESGKPFWKALGTVR